MLIDNRNFLRLNNRALLETLSLLEGQEDESIHVEKSRTGEMTMKMTIDGKEQYIHSKYNPKAEAERLVKQMENITDYDHVLFLGIGLGHHVREVLNNHPSVKVSIFEPNEAVLLQYLTYEMLPEKNIHTLMSGTEMVLLEKAKELIKVGENIYVFTLPALKEMYGELEEKILRAFKENLQDKKSSLAVNVSFQKRWTINAIKNFPKVLSTPNMLHDVDRSNFQGKPAIIVAAGPSLNEEFGNLRYIKENGLAYIFSVGSAINALIEQDIYPDAACTYDPQAHNERVVKIIKENNIKEIPLIFGSSVGFETLEDFPGKMLHMITNQDTIAPLFLEMPDGLNVVFDAPSIAVVTYQMASVLGCNPILFVGQNLSFSENKRYAKGIEYENISNELTEAQKKSLIKVKSVEGSDVYTDDGYLRMKQQMEAYIKSTPHIEAINTTRGGACIEGATYKELSHVIKERLTVRQVVEDWANVHNNYNLEYSSKRVNEMLKEEADFYQILKNAYTQLNNIYKAVSQRRTNTLDQDFQRFDKEFDSIRTSAYYKNFIQPMLRVENERLIERTADLKYEKNLLKRGERVVQSFKLFFDACNINMQLVRPLLKEIEKETYKLIQSAQE